MLKLVETKPDIGWMPSCPNVLADMLNAALESGDVLVVSQAIGSVALAIGDKASTKPKLDDFLRVVAKAGLRLHLTPLERPALTLELAPVCL